MRLNLREILSVPGSSLPFSDVLDLSHLEFFGERPIARPLRVHGQVRNKAGALMLEGTADTVLELVCDRCGTPFEKEKSVVLDTLLAAELENKDSDQIVLLDGEELDLGELASTAFILAMDTKSLCKEDCKGLCSGCGVNLNEAPCRCKPEVDPRLAALGQLLDK
jgi:uncharacterized protein